MLIGWVLSSQISFKKFKRLGLLRASRSFLDVQVRLSGQLFQSGWVLWAAGVLQCVSTARGCGALLYSAKWRYPPQRPSLQLPWVSMLHPGCVLHNVVCFTSLWLCSVSIHIRIKSIGKVSGTGTLEACFCHWWDHSCIPETEMLSPLPFKQANRKIYTVWYGPAGHSGTRISCQLGLTASGISVGAGIKSQEKKLYHELHSALNMWNPVLVPLSNTDQSHSPFSKPIVWYLAGDGEEGFFFAFGFFFHWSLYII